MEESVFLSIIIVNLNTRHLLEECITSIYKYPPQKPYEIIVVDNASTDGSVDIISQKFPYVKLIINPQNYGYSKANNIGIKSAKGKYVLLLNSDTEILENSLETLTSYMENNPEVGVVGPLLLGSNREIIQMSWGWYPTIFKETLQKFLSPRYIQKNFIIKHITHYLLKRERETDLISGACMLIRKDIFNAAGYLDENIFLYFEEPDFCKRVASRGFKIMFLPQAKIIHKLGQSMKKIGSISNYHYLKSQLYYYRKHNSPLQQFILKYYLILKHLIKYFLTKDQTLRQNILIISNLLKNY